MKKNAHCSYKRQQKKTVLAKSHGSISKHKNMGTSYETVSVCVFFLLLQWGCALKILVRAYTHTFAAWFLIAPLFYVCCDYQCFAMLFPDIPHAHIRTQHIIKHHVFINWLLYKKMQKTNDNDDDNSLIFGVCTPNYSFVCKFQEDRKNYSNLISHIKRVLFVYSLLTAHFINVHEHLELHC